MKSREAYHREPFVEPGEWINNPARACNGLDTEAFFPERGGGADEETKRAKKVCRHCLVRAECLAYAVDCPSLSGIWGGTTEAQRRLLRRERRAA